MSYKKKSVFVTVLDAADAPDASLSGGKLTVTGLETIALRDALSYVKTSYSAGVPSVKTVDFTTSNLSAEGYYRLAIEVPGRKDFPNGGQEANELNAIREYNYGFGSSAPSAANVADAIKALIDADPYARVSVTSLAGVLTLTLLDVAEGDFTPSVSAYAEGATIGTTTPYVAPAGTPEIVQIEAGAGTAAPAGEYSTWEIVYDRQVRNGNISGLKAGLETIAIVYAEENAGTFGAFEAALDAMLDGTHTPVSDYLGV